MTAIPSALVTGSAGFVGRHIVRALLDRGYFVTSLDTVTGHDCRVFFDNAEDWAPDLVVHCAAVVGGRTMIEGEPLRLACEDLSIDAALFGWALRARPGRIIYFSSSAAYPLWLQTGGKPWQLAETDIDPGFLAMPDQTYGWVKLTGERLAAEANTEGIPTHVFRPFSGYGADQDPAYPFPAIVARALAREDPLTVWSDTVRDFVHIDDVVGCVLAAIDADVLGPLNICTGRPTSFRELAELVSRYIDGTYAPAVEVLDDKPTGVAWRVGDPTRMLDVYTPTVTLEEGVARAVAACRVA